MERYRMHAEMARRLDEERKEWEKHLDEEQKERENMVRRLDEERKKWEKHLDEELKEREKMVAKLDRLLQGANSVRVWVSGLSYWFVDALKFVGRILSARVAWAKAIWIVFLDPLITQLCLQAEKWSGSSKMCWVGFVAESLEAQSQWISFHEFLRKNWICWSGGILISRNPSSATCTLSIWSRFLLAIWKNDLHSTNAR